MLHRLSGGDRCPFPLQSQNPKSNQVVEVLGKGQDPVVLGKMMDSNRVKDSLLVKKTSSLLC